MRAVKDRFAQYRPIPIHRLMAQYVPHPSRTFRSQFKIS